MLKGVEIPTLKKNDEENQLESSLQELENKYSILVREIENKNRILIRETDLLRKSIIRLDKRFDVIDRLRRKLIWTVFICTGIGCVVLNGVILTILLRLLLGRL